MQPNVLLRLSALAICLVPANLSLFAQGATVVSPQVQVTFYSSGNFLKSAMPGYKYGKFSGRIMDEYDQLAMLTFDHFITFNLDPGPHTFSANSWMIPRPEGGGHLKIDLVVGKHYYIGTYLEPLLVASKFRFEQRTCEEAQQENKNTKSLERKHLKDYGLARVFAETSFPTCP
jgi:hypothetical protein